MGSTRETEPTATTRFSYPSSCVPTSVSTVTVRASSSTAVARPSRSSACGHIIRRGTTQWRGSSIPEAASGSMGEKSMKFSRLTMVAPRLPSERAT